MRFYKWKIHFWQHCVWLWLGNQIDFAGRREVSFILKEVYHCMEQELVIDDSTGLLRELEKTRKLLYLGDNCGEIGDKLFIEMIRKRYPNLTVLYGVRGRPVVNDVTLEGFQNGRNGKGGKDNREW